MKRICAAARGKRLPWLTSLHQFLPKGAEESDTILSDFGNSFSHQPGEDFPLQDRGMIQLNLIGAILNPKLINKQNYTPERHSGMFFINSHFLVSKKSLWLKLIGGNSYKDFRMLAW